MPDQQELLIAQLSELDYEGFEQGDQELKAFVPEGYYDPGVMKELAFKYQLSFTEEKIKSRNWNELWETNFQPVIVDDFAAIRADFHPAIENVEHEIIITPKMSFGTGHHATTYMMVQQMRSIDFDKKKVLDFGTGTGILAILAEKKGASEIKAIDNDEWSIENAAENIARNNCSHIVLENAEVVPSGQRYDIILANINKHVIVNNFQLLSEQLNEMGILLLSGLLAEDEADIINEAGKYALKAGEKTTRGNWLSIRFSH